MLSRVSKILEYINAYFVQDMKGPSSFIINIYLFYYSDANFRDLSHNVWRHLIL